MVFCRNQLCGWFGDDLQDEFVLTLRSLIDFDPNPPKTSVVITSIMVISFVLVTRIRIGLMSGMSMMIKKLTQLYVEPSTNLQFLALLMLISLFTIPTR